MKLTLLILIIIIELIGYSFCINENNCFKFGESCKDNIRFDVTCGENFACLPIDERNNQDFICKPKLKLGEQCYNEFSDVCERGLQCLPLTPFNYEVDEFGDFDLNSSNNFSCIDAGYAGEGEFCQSDYNCIGSGFYNLKCIHSKCKLNTIEHNENITCIGYYNCPGPTTCASLGFDNNGNYISKCVPLKPLKSDCKTQSECFIGGICSSSENICISRYSKKLNETCLYNSECDFGLRCETTIYHYFPNGTFYYFEEINKCVPLIYSNTTNCSEEGCQEYEFCNGETNKCYPKKKYTNDCKEAEKERDSCYISNNCYFSNEHYDLLSSDSPFSNEKSCQMKFCKYQTINYFNQCQNTYTFCQ
ncbi:hypothetical protein ACTFIZ_011321 [Dictyostelium cf. discoideum]